MPCRRDEGAPAARRVPRAYRCALIAIIFSLQENNINDDGAAQLGQGLGKSKSLTGLDIGYNRFGASGAKGLSEGLSENDSLTSEAHVMVESFTESRVVEVVANMPLSQNVGLHDLDLLGSDIGNVGADGLAEGLAKNSSLARLTGFPELPECFEWPYLLTAAKGMARADRIRKYLFDVEAKKWTPAAYELAGKYAHIFQVFVFILAQNDPEMQNLFSDPKVWLQTEGEDEDKSAEDEDKLPLIHALFDCHATTTEFALQESFCTEIIAKHLKLEDGLLLMKAEDGGGRTLRSLALTNKNTKEWAKKYGTYLNRYNVVEGPPVHESKTCAVHYATDIKTNKLVALKIMRDKHQYEREISAREVTVDGEDLLKGCMKLLDRDDPAFATLLDRERCLVMPQGSRSLFEAINTERFAGRDFLKIRAIAHKIALAIKNLHDSGRIHGDIKPRNVVRVNPSVQHTFSLDGKGGRLEVPKAWRDDVTGELQSSRSNANDEEWKLIDLDASASLLNDTRVTEKVSTGYAAPELARWHFSDHAKPEEAPLTSEAIDVWGFGVVLYQMLSGTKLFMVDESDDNLVHDEDKLKLMTWLALDDKRLNRIRKRENSNGIEGKNAAVGDGLQEERSDDIEAARDLVRLCLRGDPSERITLTYILEKHPFFESLREDASCAVQDDDVDLASSKVARKRSSKKNMKDRISRQLLGLHFRMIPRRFSLFGHTTTPELRRNASLSRFYADKAHHELIELPTYHFFLSHVQSQAAGIAKDLAFGLERHQLSAWVDMRAADITLEGMHRGILFSRCFLMVLTQDVFFRPYCLIELKYAVDHFLSTPGGLEEHIFFIVEEDERFYPWTAENDGPWESELWENGDADDLNENTDDTDDLDENADDAEDYFDMCEGSVLERPRSKRKDDARHHPRDELKKLGFNDTEVFTAARDALSVCKRIPYRRREFEEDAMIRALASHAGFQKSSPFSFPSKDSLSLTVVGKAGSTIARELVAKLEAKRNIEVKAALFPSLASDTSVAIVVLEQGCRDDVEFALREGELAELPILAVAVADDKTRNLDGVHKEDFSEDVRIRLFDHLEVLTGWPGGSSEHADEGAMEGVLNDVIGGRDPRKVRWLSLGRAAETFGVEERLTDVRGLEACESLVSLDLSGHALSNADRLRLLRKLQELDVSRNRLRHLEGLGRLTNLRVLNLSGNLVERIPEQMGLLVELQWLDLSANKLGDPSEFSHLAPCGKLFRLFIKGNPLCGLPTVGDLVLKHCASLVWLDGTEVTRDGRAGRALPASATASAKQLDEEREAKDKILRLERQIATERASVQTLEAQNHDLKSELEATAQLLARKTSEWAVAEEQASRLQQELAFLRIDASGTNHAPVDDAVAEPSSAGMDASLLSVAHLEDVSIAESEQRTGMDGEGTGLRDRADPIAELWGLVSRSPLNGPVFPSGDLAVALREVEQDIADNAQEATLQLRALNMEFADAKADLADSQNDLDEFLHDLTRQRFLQQQQQQQQVGQPGQSMISPAKMARSPERSSLDLKDAALDLQAKQREVRDMTKIRRHVELLHKALRKKLECAQDLLVLHTERLMADKDETPDSDSHVSQLASLEERIASMKSQLRESAMHVSMAWTELSEVLSGCSESMRNRFPDLVELEGLEELDEDAVQKYFEAGSGFQRTSTFFDSSVAALSEQVMKIKEYESSVQGSLQGCDVRLQQVRRVIEGLVSSTRVDRANSSPQTSPLPPQSAGSSSPPIQRADGMASEAGVSQVLRDEEEVLQANVRNAQARIRELQAEILQLKCEAWRVEANLRTRQCSIMCAALEEKEAAVQACSKTMRRLQTSGALAEQESKTGVWDEDAMGNASYAGGSTCEGDEVSLGSQAVDAAALQHQRQQQQQQHQRQQQRRQQRGDGGGGGGGGAQSADTFEAATAASAALMVASEQKAREFRRKVVDDLVESEAQYLEALRQLVNSFLVPMRRRCLLPPRDLQAICLNAEDIFRAHESIGNALERCHEPMEILGVYAKRAERFEAYINFGVNCSLSMAIVEVRQREVAGFANFVRVTPQGEDGCEVLRGLLLRPLQQLCVYEQTFHRLLDLNKAGGNAAMQNRLEGLASMVTDLLNRIDCNVEEAKRRAEALAHVTGVIPTHSAMDRRLVTWLTTPTSASARDLGLSRLGWPDVQSTVLGVDLVLLFFFFLGQQRRTAKSGGSGDDVAVVEAVVALSGDGEAEKVYSVVEKIIGEYRVEHGDKDEGGRGRGRSRRPSRDVSSSQESGVLRLQLPGVIGANANGGMNDKGESAVASMADVDPSDDSKLSYVPKYPGTDMAKRRELARRRREARTQWKPPELENVNAVIALERIRKRDGTPLADAHRPPESVQALFRAYPRPSSENGRGSKSGGGSSGGSSGGGGGSGGAIFMTPIKAEAAPSRGSSRRSQTGSKGGIGFGSAAKLARNEPLPFRKSAIKMRSPRRVREGEDRDGRLQEGVNEEDDEDEEINFDPTSPYAKLARQRRRQHPTPDMSIFKAPFRGPDATEAPDVGYRSKRLIGVPTDTSNVVKEFHDAEQKFYHQKK
ncbi:Leucine-rich repeat-containing protein 9 [Hondaea fermentalgiana]|uniref:Leucine-rich repeat-containing protein 9 n=1 Tax=Hondaea fermentalgiana TaxID=2315210 RepID=A0A2R5G8K1_9STRA|nr:Leucine-rich repeat-containing protein 9 [Hondaea fermentalgiana]|eukprot:GBG27377.1 Leucine-rich repeat-containing protein 9 [Hondaea fermentalgiana]